MGQEVKIKNAIISVYYKDKLEPIIQKLNELGVTIYSTGGTAKFIADLGIEVETVEDLTNYPSILGGRVKTLHPKVFGGILARRDVQEDVQQMEQYELPSMDLVIVDLYPFEETLRNTDDETEIIEKIDIGGVSLIRAAAKNFKDVLVISSKNQYNDLSELLTKQNGVSSIEQRKEMAGQAFFITTIYDGTISSFFHRNETKDNIFYAGGYAPGYDLRYGENPHQQARFFGQLDKVFTRLNGKEISYNNLVDIESAIYLIEEFREQYERDKLPTFAILKHTNSCGVATAKTLSEAWDKAFAADPLSAFGGVLISNAKVDAGTANKINELFFEVLIAPAYEDDALSTLQSKKNRILLLQKMTGFPPVQFKSVLNGVLQQDRNTRTTAVADLQFVTKKRPSENEVNDLLFAEKIVKHLKSNGISIVKNHQLIGCGVGQTSRVDALQQAIAKAKKFGFDVTGAVMASEAFFPFPDCVEIAHQAGITAIIQPGGSVKDKDSIDYCDVNNMGMVTTGIRHFKH
ncbi:MAG: bifunctional phosphoribosylaminoimidazolecarboxamide formyltransferase/IMP cyclohydrolase [Chitinophagales bacterium]|nr:bifunctional phosphoribosylaminoimidazolecarboxamide formyltransferase/IMP cyclohydrolase [Chitinophagales bacterium]